MRKTNIRREATNSANTSINTEELIEDTDIED